MRVVMVAAVIRGRPMVRRRGRMVAAVMPTVVIGAAVVVVGIVVGVVMVFVVVVVAIGAMVTAKALTQGEFGGQLPDGLPLVQDGLLLPHQTLAQMQDGGFGLVGHHAAPAAAVVAARLAVAARPVGHAGRGVAAWVGFWGNRGADKFGANAVVIFNAWQISCY